jgi:septal ring factor EnvC (AmiA/AmiB activator)
MASTADRILKLREDAAKAAKLRADAEASVNVARQQLAQTDEALKGLGIDPEHCEQELAALEGQLDQLVNELSVKVAEEAKVYVGILDAAKQAGLR